MKKLFKIGAVALAMAVVLAGCADPNNQKTEETNKENNTTSTRKAVASPDEATEVIKAIGYDAVYTFETTFYDLYGQEDVKTDIIDNVYNSETTSLINPIDLDLNNKTYTANGIKVELKKGAVNVTTKESKEQNPTPTDTRNPATNPETKNIDFNGTVDIDAKLTIDGTKVQVKDITNPNSNDKPVYSAPRDNKILAINGNVTVKATDVEGTLVEKIPTKISGKLDNVAINAKIKYDLGENNYAGYAKLSATLKSDDLKKLYDSIENDLSIYVHGKESEKSVLGPLVGYLDYLGRKKEFEENKNNPNPDPNLKEPEPVPYPTDEQLNAIYTWADSLPITVNASLEFTNVEDKAPFKFVTLEKLSDIIKLSLPEKPAN